jgi:hypothetical protein
MRQIHLYGIPTYQQLKQELVNTTAFCRELSLNCILKFLEDDFWPASRSRQIGERRVLRPSEDGSFCQASFTHLSRV